MVDFKKAFTFTDGKLPPQHSVDDFASHIKDGRAYKRAADKAHGIITAGGAGEIGAGVEELKDIARELKQVKKAQEKNTTEQLNDWHKEQVEVVEERLKDKSPAHYEKMSEAVSAHRDAIGELTDAHKEAVEKLGDEHKTALDKLAKEHKTKLGTAGADKEALAAEFEANKKLLVEQGNAAKKDLDAAFKREMGVHDKVIKDVEKLAGDVEKHTGFKAADHMSGKATSAFKGSVVAEKTALFQRIGNNFKGGSGLKAGIGLVVAGVGGLKAADDLMVTMGLKEAGRNADGTEKEGPGIIKTLAEAGIAAGGLFLAGHGGHAR
ncbi:MAG: hypothetical protein EBX40_06830 [Gammaproteobacteria bacterium]|nr:hypothetical protein [Gammaproteobacteria bacterium]